MYTVKNLFDSISVIEGIRVGGDGKNILFGCKRLPFGVPGNRELRTLLDRIVQGCTDSYDNINPHQMERLYGFESHWNVPDIPIDRIDLARTDSEDELPCAEETLVDSAFDADIQCAPGEDPCVVKGFLSEPGGLVKLFREHARCGRLDKANDQFQARRHQVVYEGPSPARHRRTASSTTGSCPSSTESLEGSCTSHSRQFASDLDHAGPSISSTASGSKKRARSEEAAETTEAEGRETEDSVHRNKRTKTMLMQQVEDD